MKKINLKNLKKIIIAIVLTTIFQLYFHPNIFCQTPPPPPTSVTASILTLCSFGTSDLTAVSTGNIIRWWNASIGGVLLGTSASGAVFQVSLFASETFYAESYDGNLPSLSRDSVTVTVIPSPADPLTAFAYPDTIGTGQSTTLNVSGTLSNGDKWVWYEHVCGIGTKIGTGSSLGIYPLSSTTYFVRAENGICYSNCVSALLILPGNMNNARITLSPDNFEIFPNPINDKVTIELQIFNAIQKNIISIYNIQGQKIMEQPIEQRQTEFDISWFEKGIYILKLINCDKIEVIKFVKE
jgi:hypothetical protein